MEIHAILFDKDLYKRLDAYKWIIDHKYTPIKRVLETDNFYRYTMTKADNKNKDYRSHKTSKGIVFIFEISKNSKSI